ncbi:MAG: hypothetical protein M3323_09075 [Actinomycetota bacterium]|nr:hypothetical protein [Actinomycetota bacterium]
MKRFRLLVVGAVAVASLGLGAAPASACQPDSPCPCAEEPTRTLNNTWNHLTGRDLVYCTY